MELLSAHRNEIIVLHGGLLIKEFVRKHKKNMFLKISLFKDNTCVFVWQKKTEKAPAAQRYFSPRVITRDDNFYVVGSYFKPIQN